MRKLRRRMEDDDEEHMDESWLLPYADLLTLLLALFIILYSASSINKAKYESIMSSLKSEFTGTKIESQQSGLSPTPFPTKAKDQGTPAGPNDLDQLQQQLQGYIESNHLQEEIALQDTKRGVEITLKDAALFDPGKADLKDSSFQTLDTLVGLVSAIPNRISFEGYTDNVPIGNAAYASNWELSSARAASVLHYFASKNIAENRLQFTGYGEYQPLFPNDTKEHRQANRRVNIVVLKDSEISQGN